MSVAEAMDVAETACGLCSFIFSIKSDATSVKS